MNKSSRNIAEKKEEYSSRKRIAIFLLFLNVVTSAAVSIYIPCLRQMAIDLHTSNALLQMTIVVHLVGEFIGRFTCGPLIDFYGSRRVVLPALMLSILGHLGCFLADSLSLFMIMRFLQATGSSVIYIVSVEIIIAEFNNENERNGIVGILELYQPIAWILSPFVGCIFAEIHGWRLSFLILMISQVFGIFFFWIYHERTKNRALKVLSVAKYVCDYGSILKNSHFVTYALIPGLFAGGYMIFASNSPFICARILGNRSADIAIFQAVPLIFYVLATFAYRSVVRGSSIKVAKKIGIGIYTIFGLYMTFVVAFEETWTAYHLLALMCLQCVGSAFLVPVSILKALQSSAHVSCIGASTVVVFRNIIMSLCISMGTKMSESITMIMGAVFMNVGTVLVLMFARKIMKKRYLKKINSANFDL
ncbi:MAG: MFS transporter [Holosporaceae bacterium]|nr:MFS transporter [Holosporaceae bacterium]